MHVLLVKVNLASALIDPRILRRATVSSMIGLVGQVLLPVNIILLCPIVEVFASGRYLKVLSVSDGPCME